MSKLEIDNDNGEIRVDGYEYAASKISIKTYGISSEISQTSNSADLRLTDSDGYTDNVTVTGGSNVTITRNNSSKFTIDSYNSDTTYSIEASSSIAPSGAKISLKDSNSFMDNVYIVQGTGVGISYSGGPDSITVSNSGVTQVNPGFGITTSGQTGNVTVNNDGVTRFNGAKGSVDYYSFSRMTDGNNIAIADVPSDMFGFNAGSGISAVVDGYTDSITITNTGVTSFNTFAGPISYNSFGRISDGYNTAIADLALDTINFVGGSGIGVLVNVPGDSLTIANNGVTSLASGTGISVSGATGNVTVGNTGVTSLNGGGGAQFMYNTFTDGVTPTTASSGHTTMTLSGSNGIKITTSPDTATVSMSQVSIVRATDAVIGFGATTAIMNTGVIPINTTVEIQGVFLLAFSNGAAINTYTVSLTTGSGTIGGNTSKVALGFAAHASPTAGSPGETTKQAPSFTYPQQINNTNDHTLRFSGIFQTDGTTPNSIIINIKNNCANPGENLVVYAKSFMKHNVV